MWQGGMNLEGTYAVTLNGEKRGTVTLTRRGLYYEVICRCHTTEKQMLHLVVKTRTSEENLGLLIPAVNTLELRKQVSAKRIGEGEPVFFLQARQEHTSEFMPVCPQEPFPWLHRLEECVFSVRNGIIGVEWHWKNSAKKVEI
jgi:hypothetical protein